MSESMTHEQAREALEALALDALDTSERDAAMAHVADCTMCQSELAVLENTANELAYAAAPLPMTPEQRARIRSRLMARASTRTGTGGDDACVHRPGAGDGGDVPGISATTRGRSSPITSRCPGPGAPISSGS